MRDIIAKIRGNTFRLWCKIRKQNIHIEKNLMIYKKFDVRGPGKVEIGKNCAVYGVRGDKHQYVTVYTHSSEAIIRIGNNARLFATRLSSRFAVTIGDDVLIEESGLADTDFHSIDRNRNTPTDERKDRCEVVIGNKVSIGSRSIIGKGVRIGDDSIIGPGSIVTKSIPAGCFALGNPARIVSNVKKENYHP